ncbi:MAG: aspartate aminotransferase family protein [Caldilineaceae bacterium]|nr:aspartate aminotransferase family protein [Caldilineaceae bacterium]
MKLTARQENLLKRTSIGYMPLETFLQNPLVVERAQGLYYWDVEGKRYFDGIGGIFVAVLGHGHARLLDAMRKQMEIMTFAPPLHGISDVTLNLIEKLGAVTPEDLNYVKLYSGGSESIEAALKFVRQYFKQSGHPGKYKFISRYQSYHGSTLGAMSLGGTGKRKTPFEPQANGFVKVFPPTYYRDRFSSWEECNRFCAQMIEDVIIHEDPETVAAVVLEPIGNTGGTITPTAEYFQIIREICDRYNVLLIFDEIITGFGRTGHMFAAQTFGVTPDIICSGKGLSSGVMPMGAVMAREKLGEAFVGPAEAELNFAHSHTFAGNPLAAAVGCALIDELVEQDLLAKGRATGDYLATKLESLKQYGVVREVRGKGMFRGVELMRNNGATGEPFPELGTALKETALRNGLIMRIDPTWFAVAPALIADKAAIDELFDLIERSLLEALEQVDGQA